MPYEGETQKFSFSGGSCPMKGGLSRGWFIPFWILCRQKELDDDPKATQQIEFVGELKNYDGVNADGTQSMFFLTVLGKIKGRD